MTQTIYMIPMFIWIDWSRPRTWLPSLFCRHIGYKYYDQKQRPVKRGGSLQSIQDYIKELINKLQKQHTSKDNERVLFQINIKPWEPYAQRLHISMKYHFIRKQKRFYLRVGFTFTVDAIIPPKTNENYYTIHLTASEIDKTLIDDICTKVENCSPSGRAVLLAQYLV